ncbi:hypothetical protein [Streptomyces sp. NBC_00996]|uniref:hypothetical protein n=1 Tax=Streptomyces sp. NBC_00996 TaxID=2903710 RepID=UPI00386D0790|nr:hypothetical protein OG390_21480 [Streptomyces sp. NBC_00996]
MTVSLPEELPAGRLVPDGSPVMWQSDEPPADPLAEWTRYQRQQGDTGLLPVLCYPNRRSDSPGTRRPSSTPRCGACRGTGTRSHASYTDR